jgi:hypothetical protein
MVQALPFQSSASACSLPVGPSNAAPTAKQFDAEVQVTASRWLSEGLGFGVGTTAHGILLAPTGELIATVPAPMTLMSAIPAQAHPTVRRNGLTTDPPFLGDAVLPHGFHGATTNPRTVCAPSETVSSRTLGAPCFAGEGRLADDCVATRCPSEDRWIPAHANVAVPNDLSNSDVRRRAHTRPFHFLQPVEAYPWAPFNRLDWPLHHDRAFASRRELAPPQRAAAGILLGVSLHHPVGAERAVRSCH